MRATIATPEGGAPGTALMEVFDAPALQGEPRFTILSPQGYLSSDGWQESSTPLTPAGWENEGGCLRIAVGPSVVDQLDPLETYRLGLGEQVCVLQIGDLLFSHMGGGQGMGPQTDPVNTEEAEEADQRNENTETQREEDTPPSEEPPAEEQASEPQPEEPPAQEVPQPPVERLTMGGEDAPKEDAPVAPEPARRNRLPLFLLLVLLLAGGGLAYHYLSSDKQPAATAPLPELPKPDSPAPPTPEAPAPAAPSAEQPQAGTPPTPAPSAPAATPAGTAALSEARELLRRNAAPEETLAAGKALRTPDADARQSDAAFLLLEDAAQKGNAEAMLLVGRFYDPASDLPRGSIPPDLSQARSWYEAARDKGNAEAAQALSSLRSFVEQKTRQGDEEARLLLQNWK